MSLAIFARKSRSTNPRYNNSKGCFRLNMTNRGKLRTCIDGYNKDCRSCNVSNKKNNNNYYETSKQSSYHNYQRKITKYCKNRNGLNGSKTNNITRIWADLSKNCLPELYKNASDIILKRKNEALNDFSNPNSKCYNFDSYGISMNSKGECIYYKDISCNPCCYKGDRIKNRIYTNRVAFKLEDNEEVKSLSDLENLKKPQSDYISKLKAKTDDAFKFHFCNNMKNNKSEIYKNKYKTVCDPIIASKTCE